MLRAVLSGRLPARYRGVEHVSVGVYPRPAQSCLFCMLVLQLHAALQPPVGDKGRRKRPGDAECRDYCSSCAHECSLRPFALEEYGTRQRSCQDRLVDVCGVARTRSISAEARVYHTLNHVIRLNNHRRRADAGAFSRVCSPDYSFDRSLLDVHCIQPRRRTRSSLGQRCAPCGARVFCHWARRAKRNNGNRRRSDLSGPIGRGRFFCIAHNRKL